MICDNDEMVGSAEDAISNIESAINDLEGISEYFYIVEMLKEDIREIKEVMQPYQENLEEEWEQENKERNREFYNSRF